MFYPGRGKRRVDELEFYAVYLNAVEINSTFYRPASAAAVRAWLKKTPDEFIFTAKAWQKFTHPAKLGGEQRDRAKRWDPLDRADIERFSEGIQPLMETRRLGALLFHIRRTLFVTQRIWHGWKRRCPHLPIFPRLSSCVIAVGATAASKPMLCWSG